MYDEQQRPDIMGVSMIAESQELLNFMSSQRAVEPEEIKFEEVKQDELQFEEVKQEDANEKAFNKLVEEPPNRVKRSSTKMIRINSNLDDSSTSIKRLEESSEQDEEPELVQVETQLSIGNVKD